MNQSILDDLVERAKIASVAVNRSEALREVLQSSLHDPDKMADAIAALDENEVLLHEDENCSIWTCRFDTDTVLPPHEHCMPVHIAVHRGAELEILYRRDKGTLRHIGNEQVSAGQLVTLDPDAIHAVTAEGTVQSHAIHIYEGPLTTVTRSLFDWKSGDEIEFTMDNLYSMKRDKSGMDEEMS